MLYPHDKTPGLNPAAQWCTMMTRIPHPASPNLPIKRMENVRRKTLGDQKR